MADDPENHTIRLLQEMRAEMREGFEDLTTRINGNTLILNMMMGMIHDHEERLAKLEEGGRDA